MKLLYYIKKWNTGDIVFKDIENRNTLSFILISIIFFQVSTVFSEDQNSERITASVYTYALDEDPIYSFSDIINNTTSLELKVAGFRVFFPEYTADTEELLMSSYSSGASFLIESSYSIKNGSIQIDFNCYRTDDSSKIYSTSRSGELDLELDSVIKEATTEIITQIKHNIERRPLTIPQNADKIEKTEITPSTEKEEIVTDETDSIEETTEKESETVPDIDPENFRHFTISAGFSPFLTTGKASNYFTYGLMPVQYTGYRFHTSYGYFSSGLFSSLNYFTAEGVLVSSENILISAGPEIRFGFTAYPFQDLFFRLSGGGTFFMMNTNNKGYISTVIPFASGGMGLTMNVTPWFGIVVSLNYSLYIEYSILISGFSPSGNISLRL